MNQLKKDYSVLIIEDNPGDQLLLEENLKSTGLLISHITTADTISKAIDILAHQSFSIIFLDLFLPDSSGLETFTVLINLCSRTPVIISSGLSDTKVAIKAISMGAQDFLIKGDYTSALLEKAFRYSIGRKDAEQLIKASEESYRYLFDNNPVAIFIWEVENFKVLEVNESAVNLYGYSKEEFRQRTLFDICSGDGYEKLIQSEDRCNTGMSKHINRKGEILNVAISSHRIVYLGKQAVLTLSNDITEKVLLEEKLAEERIKKQQEITAAIITTQEQERTFLAEELHDNINQILATANLYLDCSLSQEDEKSMMNLVKDGKQLVKDAMEEIRKLTKTLLPPSLGKLGLSEALNEVLEKIKRVNDTIHFYMDWQIPAETVLTEKLELAIFRIVQEQLNNIFKYAKATNIIINLKEAAGELELTIKDDGIGFDTSQKRNGVGLQNISERSALLNGKASINSKPGAGCELIVTFNIKNEVPDSTALRA